MKSICWPIRRRTTAGVYLVPAFTGLGAPHWDPYARGAIIGITRDTSAAHIARAALEGVAYQVADLIDAMYADTGKTIEGIARGWRSESQCVHDAVPG